MKRIKNFFSNYFKAPEPEAFVSCVGPNISRRIIERRADYASLFNK